MGYKEGLMALRTFPKTAVAWKLFIGANQNVAKPQAGISRSPEVFIGQMHGTEQSGEELVCEDEDLSKASVLMFEWCTREQT